MQTYTNDLDETQLPGKPKLRLTKPGADSIFVSWDPPKDRTVMVRGYTIGWGKGFPDAYTELLDEKLRHFNIKNLGRHCFRYLTILCHSYKFDHYFFSRTCC